MISIRTRCRGCASTALTPVLSLGAQVIAGSFGISKDFPPIARRIPLELVRCDIARDQDACGLVQLRHTVPGDLMYAAYGYRSGLNEAMAAHLAELARDMERRVRLRAGDLVVDIGANDGTLLAAYTVGDVLLYGFEPSDVEPERPLPRVHFIHDYFSARSLRARIPAAQARIVTSIAMFYDLDDPNSFVADVAAILAPDGLWAIELSYLPSMLAQNSFDTICHEHLEYYSLGPLERLLSRHGMAIADVSLNDVNGGSVRVLVCHQGSLHRERSREAKARIYALKKRECELALDTSEPYDAFARRLDAGFFAAGFFAGDCFVDGFFAEEGLSADLLLRLRAPFSYAWMYVSTGLRRMASPRTSRARSSTFLKRMQLVPMSSFLPALAQARSKARRSFSLPSAHMM